MSIKKSFHTAATWYVLRVNSAFAAEGKQGRIVRVAEDVGRFRGIGQLGTFLTPSSWGTMGLSEFVCQFLMICIYFLQDYVNNL